MASEIFKIENPREFEKPSNMIFLQAALHAVKLGMKVIPLDSAFSVSRTQNLVNKLYWANLFRLEPEKKQLREQIDKIRIEATNRHMERRIKKHSPDVILTASNHQPESILRAYGYNQVKVE